ncbi:MAG: zf-HC2 domain-containing protein [Massilia sp.]
MNLHPTIPGDAAARHGTVAPLLPWSLTGTLADDEQALVERHLQECAACRDDLAWQRQLQQAMPLPPGQLDVDAALARMLPRLEAPPAQLPWWRRLERPWLAWLAGGQAVALAVLAMLLLSPFRLAPPADYRALGAGGARSGELVIQFRADTTEAEMRRILQESGARIKDGPTAQGAFVLSAPGGDSRAVLQALRRERAVVLAETLGGPAP